MGSRVDVYLHPAGRGDLCLILAGRAEQHARLIGNDAGYRGVIGLLRRRYRIRLQAVEDDDRTRWQGSFGGNPLGYILVFRVDDAVHRYIAGEMTRTGDLEPRVGAAGSDADIAPRDIEEDVVSLVVNL